MVNCKFKWITPKILEIRFDNNFELCDATYLFSHHYEDPTWSGKIFTRLELDEFYIKEYDDANFWKNRWAGSNLPDKSFQKFVEGRFIGLNDFELRLVEEVRNKPDPYYVIMTSEEALYARDHELAHAIWYTEQDYRDAALDVVNENRDLIGEATRALKKAGYSDAVIDDELHVYCGIYYDKYLSHYGIHVPSNMRKVLNYLFYEYKSKLQIPW